MNELESALERMKAPPEAGIRLAQRLTKFIEDHVQDWPRHEQYLDLPKWKRQRVVDEMSNWDKLMGFVTPRDLPNHGKDELFIAIWNNTGNLSDSKGLIPMEIWLAKGKSVAYEEPIPSLIVEYIKIGTLRHGTTQIVFEKDYPKEPSGQLIHFNSHVILNP